MGARAAWSSRLALALIVVCLLAEALLLTTGIDELDEGYFLQQASRVALHGQVPYLNFDSLYTPGLLYLHAALLGLLGRPSSLALRSVALAGRAAVALLLFGLARPLVRRPIWAALPGVFLLVGLDAAPSLWEPHPGWLSTVFGLVATWCMVQGRQRRWLLAAGGCAALTYLFKQNTGIFILLAVLLVTRRPEPLAAFAVITLAWLLPLLVAIHGQLTLLSSFVGIGLNAAALYAPPEPPVLVALAGLAAGIWLSCQPARDRRVRTYLIAGIGLFCTQYPRMDTLHLAWSAPLLLVLGAVALDRLPLRLALLAVPALGLAAVPVLQYRFGPLVPGDAETRLEVNQTVADIDRLSPPDAPIFVYPSSPLLYVLAGRTNPTRFDHLYPGAASPAQVQGVLADLDAAHVRVVVVSDYWEQAWGPPGPNQPIVDWIAANFHEVARHGAYQILAYNPPLARMFGGSNYARPGD